MVAAHKIIDSIGWNSVKMNTTIYNVYIYVYYDTILCLHRYCLIWFYLAYVMYKYNWMLKLLTLFPERMNKIGSIFWAAELVSVLLWFFTSFQSNNARTLSILAYAHKIVDKNNKTSVLLLSNSGGSVENQLKSSFTYVFHTSQLPFYRTHAI